MVLLYYDKKAGDVTFEEGDRVWLAAKLRKPGLSLKLQPKWLGPYTIIAKQRQVDYVIQADDNKKRLQFASMAYTINSSL